MTAQPIRNPFTLYSCIIDDFACLDYSENKGVQYKDRNGHLYSDRQFDSILPFFYYHQLASDGRLPDSLNVSGDLDCLKGTELVVSAAPSFAVRETGRKIAPYLTPDTILVSVSKGIERDTNLRMSQILAEVTGNACKVVALSGPSHAEEVGVRQPTGCVSACRDLQAARMVQDAFMNDYFRVYTSEDIVGVELSGAMKNVVALACGVCDGMGYQDNTKALLMTRAMAELTRLGEKLGGTR